MTIALFLTVCVAGLSLWLLSPEPRVRSRDPRTVVILPAKGGAR